MTITIEQLRELAPWHFDLDVGNGLKTSAGNDGQAEPVNSVDPGKIGKLLRRIYPDGLAGKRFLDVACNGGAYSLLARDLGAERVLGFDVREHWIRQARFLHENLPGRRDVVSFERWDLRQADQLLGEERFDICLFKGIFYHLPDPVAALAQVARRTEELLILDTETAIGLPDGCLQLFHEGTENPMSGVHELAWLPTGPAVLESIFRWLGFPACRLVFWKKPPGRSCGRLRMVAAREVALLESFDSRQQ